MNFCDSKEEEKFFKIRNLLNLFIREISNVQGISNETKEQILGHQKASNVKHISLNSEKFGSSMPKKLEEKVEKALKLKINSMKKDSLTPTLHLIVPFVNLRQLIKLRKLNKKSYLFITTYLKSERLVFEEERLVRSVFSLESYCNSFSLNELKQFCLQQIPKEARDFICLDYEEIQQKIHVISKNDFKSFREIKYCPKEFDKLFRPFCRLFLKKPILIKNEQGFSEENWFETFRKLITKLILMAEVGDLSYFLDLMSEEHIVIFLKDLPGFIRENSDKYFRKFEKIIDIYKILISCYFSENPFIVRTKLNEKSLEQFSYSVCEQLKTINYVRKIVGVNEKMKIILDFKGIEQKKTIIITQEILNRVYHYLNHKSLAELRILSKDNKKVIESILMDRLCLKMTQLPQKQREIICFFGNYKSLAEIMPKNAKDFRELKQKLSDLMVFNDIFPEISSFDDFSNLKNNFIPNVFHLKIFTLKKIQNCNPTDNSSYFEYLIKSLKLLYPSNSSNNVFELLFIVSLYNGLTNLKPANASIKTFLASIDKQPQSPHKNVISVKSKGFFFKDINDFLIFTNKIIVYLNIKVIYSWSLTSQVCRVQSYHELMTRTIILKKQLKSQELHNKNVIQSLNRLRKLNKKIDRSPSEGLENIENLSALDIQEIRNLKSLNKFPKKYELFLKPFIILFGSNKKTKFHSFQLFLKRKDLNQLMMGLNIELLSHETIHLLEKYLFEFREFFYKKEENGDTFEKITKWLQSLVGFFSNVRKYHVSYEERQKIKFPENFVKILERLDLIMQDIFICMKLSDSLKNEIK